ncbi:efflux RND transporter periplasmic adaptor subunit [Patescibacteria group bacterium]|nr:efflux RND transporter periplasmic adaptor subunit [Patescibacteria group bacterium]
MKFHFSKKFIIILAIIIVAIIVFFIIKATNKNNNYDLFTVQRGDVRQEISETGTVKKGEEIDLSFKTSGRIEKLYIKKGDAITMNTLIAKIDNATILLQIEQAKANLSLAEAELNKLLAGASEETIQVAKTTVNNAQNILESEQKDLENTKAGAEQDLIEAYEDAYNTMDDAYLDLYNAFVVIDSIHRTYFIANEQDSVDIQQRKTSIGISLDEMKSYLDLLGQALVYGDIDVALEVFESYLSEAKDHLSIIKNITEKPIWRNQISSTDKASLDTNRSNVISVFANVVDAKQTISSTQVANQTNISTAENAVLTAENNLKTAENNLKLVIAGPRKEDIQLYQAKVDSAKADVSRFEQNLADAKLRSPIDGEVIDIHKFEGEVIQATTPVVTILPSHKLDIEVDIYEEDIVNIEIGDKVEISLVAFPDIDFIGQVIFIDPSEKLVNEVVYYEAKISFESVPDKIKPGMTADVLIITDIRENVLLISNDAVYKEGGRTMVRVYRDNQVEEREVVLGLEGSDNMIEIISGLEIDEQVIID